MYGHYTAIKRGLVIVIFWLVIGIGLVAIVSFLVMVALSVTANKIGQATARHDDVDMDEYRRSSRTRSKW